MQTTEFAGEVSYTFVKQNWFQSLNNWVTYAEHEYLENSKVFGPAISFLGIIP